jgi:glycosyltransferase involved in cell wall biosynthesis
LNKPICFLLPGWATKNTGGAELQLFHLSNQLISQNWQIEVLTTKSEIIFPENFNESLIYHYYVQKKLKSRVIAFFQLFVKLFKTNSSIYIVRTDARMERGAVRLYCKIRKRKYIISLANDPDVLFKRFYNPLQYKLKNKFVCLLKNIDDYICDFITMKCHDADLVICQNNYQYNHIKNSNKLIIHNSYFGPISEKPFSNKENLVIWVSNMKNEKRPKLFLEIVEKYSGSYWKFIMIGKSLNYTEEISKFNNKSFVYLDHLDYDETDRYFAKAKILINTSVYEGSPNTFLQSFANGVWILTLGVDPDCILKTNHLGETLDNVDDIVTKLKYLEKEIPSQNYFNIASNVLKTEFNPKVNFNKFVNVVSTI